MKQDLGFTLVELLVVVTLTGILISAVGGVMVDTFKVRSRVRVADVVEANGANILQSLRKNVISADFDKLVVCPTGTGGTGVALLDSNGGMVRLICESGKIASVSASGNFYLSDSRVTVDGCADFARCDTSLPYPVVRFNFTLKSGDDTNAGGFVQKDFSTSVTLRN